MTVVVELPRGTTDDLGVLLQIPVDQIDVGDNVRVNIEGIDELAASIKQHGLKQPIKVRAQGGRWLVVYGQRRLLAHLMAGIERIPALVADETYTAGSLAIEQLVENLHRADLPPLDRARAMRAVVDAGTSQADLARELGLAPSTIANDLGLLEAPEPIRKSIEKGELTPAHAKALKGLDASQQLEIAKRVIAEGISAHRTEELVQSYKQSWAYQAERAAAERRAAADRLARLGTSVDRLAAKKVPLDAEVRVVGYYDKKAAVDAIRKAGYTNVTTTGEISPRTSAVDCDCAAWKVEPQWNGGFSVSPGCIKPAHVAAKSRLSDHLDEQRRKLAEQSKAALKAQLLEECRGLPRMLARVVLWRALDWSVNDWVRDHKPAGKKPNAWEELTALTDEQLTTDLAEYLSRRFQDQNGIKLDWSAIATELGIETPA